MAEEGNLGLARAFDSDEDATKAELQRRMEEARDSITETVTEIKETVVNQYNSVKESVTDALDWREQFRKRPVAWSVGAIGVGIIVGYNIGGLIEGDRADYPVQPREVDDVPAASAQNRVSDPSAFTDQHSYATHARATSGSPYAPSSEALGTRPSYSSGYESAPSVEDKPGLIDRFKETRAYDRLQEEVADLGNRFMDELSNAARTIVLPALFNKVKQMIGVDLSNKSQVGSDTHRQATASRTTNEPALRSVEGRSQAAEPIQSRGPSESGKPAYPQSKGSLNKFDRLETKTPQARSQSEGAPHLNLNYDDRYEQESKLFSRGEDRGFGARAPGDNQPVADERRGTDRDDAPKAVDYNYDPGHKAE